MVIRDRETQTQRQKGSGENEGSRVREGERERGLAKHKGVMLAEKFPSEFYKFPSQLSGRTLFFLLLPHREN